MAKLGRQAALVTLLLGGLVITTGILRSGGTLAEAMPSSVGSVQLVLLVMGVLGIAYLATEYVTDRLSKPPSETSDSADSEEALEALKRRYATGEIDEIEFDRKLETLFETETVADAKRRIETKSVSDDQPTRQESMSERDEEYPQRPEGVSHDVYTDHSERRTAGRHRNDGGPGGCIRGINGPRRLWSDNPTTGDSQSNITTWILLVVAAIVLLPLVTGGGMMGGPGMIGGMMFLWPVLVVAIILVLVSGLGDRAETGGRDQAMTILRDRYGRGELSEEEFEERRRRLRSKTRRSARDPARQTRRRSR